MKISKAWLDSWVTSGWTAEELAHRLTMAGFEVESVAPAAPPFTGVVVADVVAVERHPQADKLSVCQVSAGDGELLQVVCGASNVRAGMKTALARVGAVLPGDLAIKRARLRGVESAGMLCSAKELGLADASDGIIDLPVDLATGADVREALALDDTVLELNVTPNRGDALSLLGIAREVAALSQQDLEAPAVPPVAPTCDDIFDVRLASAAGCGRFAGRVLRGLDPSARTPLWMRERLRRAGLRSLGPMVDVTNFVMLELGQPMHAYDLRRLTGHIEVRWAVAGERLSLLDGREIALATDELVIADAAGPVGLAGIMGGEKSGIADDTVDVFLEVAWFAPAAIAGRARRHGLQTDASQRFERGVDPTLQERAIERATRLLLEIAGGNAGPTRVTEVAAALPVRKTVRLTPQRVSSLIGVDLTREAMSTLLGRLGMEVAGRPEGLDVSVPPWRFDVGIEADLVEEVARLHGYDAIPPVPGTMPQLPAPATEHRVARDRALLALLERGYHEAITYSFVDPVLQQRLFPAAEALPLSNPISADLAVMRVSLWPGLLRALGDNVRRQQDRVRLAEMGTRFVVTGGALVERQTLAGVAWGEAWPQQWGRAAGAVDFYDAKGDLEAVLQASGAPGEFRFVPAELSCLRPGRTARIERNGQPVGWLGELHPEVSKVLELTGPVYLFELDTDLSLSAKPSVFAEISRYPAVRRDLAVLVAETVPLDALRETVTVAVGGILKELRTFDVYRGPGIDSGVKSVALGLILQDSSRTLTDADADAAMARAVAELSGRHGATLRK